MLRIINIYRLIWTENEEWTALYAKYRVRLEKPYLDISPNAIHK